MSSSIDSLSSSSATASNYVSGVARTSNASLGQEAAGLSTEASVVATLGGSSSGLGMYTATGLLNSLATAGADTETGSGPAQQTNVDEAILGTLPASSTTSGIYDGSGVLQNTAAPTLSSNWADVLKTDPGAASVVIAASFTKGILATV